MENIFYLFPVKSGQPGSHAHPLLQRANFPKDEDTYVLTSLNEICKLEENLNCSSQNIRSYYFSENVSEFCSGIKKGSSYPSSITLIRKKFNKRMADASSLVQDAGAGCKVFQAPVSGQDLFARAVACNLSKITDGSMLCAMPSDSNNQTIDVCVNGNNTSLDCRTADFRNVLDWLYSHHNPSRTYEPNPKHDYEHQVKGGNIASKWPYDDATSQTFLDRAFVDGKRLVYGEPKSCAALFFDEHTKDHFHGHVDVMGKVTSQVQKLLKAAL